MYERVIQAKVRKVVELTGYPMGTVATLDDGDTVTLTGSNVRRGEYPGKGWYYVQEGYLASFVNEEYLKKTYRLAAQESV